MCIFELTKKMRFSFHPTFLQFKHPFGVSGNTRTQTPVVFTKIEAEGKTGYGEAALPPYLGESHESVIDFYKKASAILEKTSYPFNFPQLVIAIDKIAEGNTAAKAGIEIALHDLFGKIINQPVHEFLKLGKSEPKLCSYTIGIGEEKLIEQKINEAKDFSILKIKLGTEDDKKIINTIRKFTGKTLAVDVNRGWKDKNFAIEMIDWLSEKNILYVEQPMPVNCNEEMEEVFKKSKLPLIADESVQRFADIEKNVPGRFHGMNIKLMKCTGIHEAMVMARFAKEKNLKVSLGCMSESSCGIAAMSQLMNFADYVDLDGPLLISNDPFTGVNYANGKLFQSDLPGTGCLPVNENIFH
jgi:L-Ala-D/L-Glu epimerase